MSFPAWASSRRVWAERSK